MGPRQGGTEVARPALEVYKILKDGRKVILASTGEITVEAIPDGETEEMVTSISIGRDCKVSFDRFQL